MKLSYARGLILIISVFILSTINTYAQPTFFTLPDSFTYGLNKKVNALGTNADGSVAVALTNDVYPKSQYGLITSFNPVTGAKLDSKEVGFGPSHVQVANTALGTRVVVLTNNGGPNSITIFDLSSTGALSQRSHTQVQQVGVDFRSNLVLSSRDRIGFLLVASDSPSGGADLVAFSLDDGRIVSRTPTGFNESTLAMSEANGRRILVYLRGHGFASISLVVCDATDAVHPQELGTVTLPFTPDGFHPGSYGLTISSDGKFLFVANTLVGFAVINLDTRQIVSREEGLFRESVRLYEGQSKRLVAVEKFGPPFGTNTLMLLDAADPSNLTLINSRDVTAETSGRADFIFSRYGNYIGLATEAGVQFLQVPSLNTQSGAALPNAQEGYLHELISFGQPARALVAWGLFTAQLGSVPFPEEAQPFDTCIQDESNGNLLQINSSTGEYQFSNCSGFTLGGAGTLKKKGGNITLEHNAADRRVSARINGSSDKATASINVFSQGIAFTIIDKSLTNNTCSCR